MYSIINGPFVKLETDFFFIYSIFRLRNSDKNNEPN